MTTPVLDIRNLSVEFKQEKQIIHAVKNISFHLMPGETLCVVGESGSGKSVTSLAIMGLLVPSARVSGEIWFDDPHADNPPADLLQLPPDQRREFRGGGRFP